MSFVTFRLQVRNDADRDFGQHRTLVENYAKAMSEWEQVHSVTVVSEPDLEARDGKLEG